MKRTFEVHPSKGQAKARTGGSSPNSDILTASTATLVTDSAGVGKLRTGDAPRMLVQLAGDGILDVGVKGSSEGSSEGGSVLVDASVNSGASDVISVLAFGPSIDRRDDMDGSVSKSPHTSTKFGQSNSSEHSGWCSSV